MFVPDGTAAAISKAGTFSSPFDDACLLVACSFIAAIAWAGKHLPNMALLALQPSLPLLIFAPVYIHPALHFLLP